MAELIEHSGEVERTDGATVWVRITSQSACGSCSAKMACGLAESQDKIVEVTTADTAAYAVGEEVMVGINKKAGSYAVFFAYILSLGVLMVVLIFCLKVMGWDQGRSAVLAFLGVGCYFAVLWLYRHKLEDKIKITIKKI